LFRLSLEVTRRLFRLQRATTNIIHCTCRSAMSTTVFVEPTVARLLSSLFFQFRKVRRFCLRRWVLIGNLARLAEKQDVDCVKFRRFRRQLFHVTLSKILESLRPGMTCPEVVRCFDGHYRRAIYSIGPYIADYPEQALVACIVQGWCPRYGVVFIDSCFLTIYIAVQQSETTLMKGLAVVLVSTPSCLLLASSE
jgi:hypothetical protein